MPVDLPTVKELLTERLESAAMKRVKEISGAKTQQGVDLPAACVDIADALEAVSRECALGIQEIADAEAALWQKTGTAWGVTTDTPQTVEHEGPDAPAAALGTDGEYYRETGLGDAQAAFDAAKAKIEAVTPLNVPVWVSDEGTIAGHVVTVKASHPTGTTITGRVTLTLWGATDGNGDPLFLSPRIWRPQNGAAIAWQAKLPSGVVYPVSASFGARNLCGPSVFKLEIEDPAA